MTKELQDLAWRCLPLEIKKEVKQLYKTRRNERLKEVSSDFIYCVVYLFGKHNLTSDAEEKEMLTVEADLVKDLYQRAKEIEEESKRIHSPLVTAKNRGVQRAIEDLFGSKCLPDETKPLSQNPPENCDNENPISNKPAEPKFHVGDIVRFKYGCTPYSVDGFKMFDDTMAYQVRGSWVAEPALEPYTEPEGDTSPNVNNSDIDIAELVAKGYVLDPATQFDAILKDGFRSHNRLHIAAMAMQGILSNENLLQYAINNFCLPEGTRNLYYAVARLALAHADTLIVESDIVQNYEHDQKNQSVARTPA